MAYFALINEDNVVVNVIVAELQDFTGKPVTVAEQDTVATTVLNRFGEGRWLATSYNSEFRGKYAGIGDTYDAEADVFVQPEEDEDDN
jgi:hypothetical protein